MANLTLTSDTIVKILVRQGTTSDRLKVLLSRGELGFTIDSNRLFIGDGITLGGLPVATVNYGIVAGKFNLSIQQNNDIVYDNTDNTLYSYVGATSGWSNIHPKNDGLTIVKNSLGIWSLNPAFLSGGSVDYLALSAVHAYGMNDFPNTLNSLSAATTSRWYYGYANLSNCVANSVKANTQNTAASAADLVLSGVNQFPGNVGAGLAAITVLAGTGIVLTPASTTLTIGNSIDPIIAAMIFG